MNRQRQVDLVLARLRRGPLTDSDCRDELGISRLGARIYDLRRLGFGIHKETVAVLNRRGETCHVARYALMCSPGADPGEEGQGESGARPSARRLEGGQSQNPSLLAACSADTAGQSGRSASPTPEPSLFPEVRA